MLKEEIFNPRYPHHVRITRKVRVSDGSKSVDNNPFKRAEAKETAVVIYDGVGRSFTDTTTTGTGEVDINKRKVSIPVRYDEWDDDAVTGRESGSVPDGSSPYPLDGDIMEVTKGAVSEVENVRDFEPGNNRTLVYGELRRV